MARGKTVMRLRLTRRVTNCLQPSQTSKANRANTQRGVLERI